MLYIATNAHVFARSFNTLDSKYKDTFPEYFTEPNNGEKVDSFIIGVPKKKLTSKQLIIIQDQM